jgi:hypothetical protein
MVWNMKLYLAGAGGVLNGSICNSCQRCNSYKEYKNMNLYLAESGGVWNAYFKERRENKSKSIAQENSHIKRCGIEGGLFSGVNILQSFYYCNDFTESMILPQCKSFMLDSGAFTFFSSGGNVNWNEYIKRYAQFIKRNNIDLYFELDIDKLIGYERVLYYRSKLEDLTGKPCIPVWHKSRGQEEFIKMCETYNYVAIGGIVSKEITQKEYKYFPYFIKTAHEHGAKIHGLGFTNLKGLTKYHFDSVDSTAWVSGNRFGSIYKFNGKTMQKFDKKQGQRLSNAKAVALHNFQEWVKFQKYAEKYL